MEELLLLGLLFAGGALVGKNWSKIKEGRFTREDLKQGVRELPSDAEKLGKVVATRFGFNQKQEHTPETSEAEAPAAAQREEQPAVLEEEETEPGKTDQKKTASPEEEKDA